MNQKQQQVDLTKTTPWLCENCGHNAFTMGMLLRKVSKFLSTDGREGLAPVQVFCCTKCGHVNRDFYPPELAITESNEKDEE